jgi:hypothetical protein
LDYSKDSFCDMITLPVARQRLDEHVSEAIGSSVSSAVNAGKIQ